MAEVRNFRTIDKEGEEDKVLVSEGDDIVHILKGGTTVLLPDHLTVPVMPGFEATVLNDSDAAANIEGYGEHAEVRGAKTIGIHKSMTMTKVGTNEWLAH